METSGIVSGVATLEYDAESICLLKCPVKYEAQTVFFFLSPLWDGEIEYRLDCCASVV